MSSQLSVVGVALLVDSFELDDAEPGLGQASGVVFGPLVDGGGEPEGGGVDGGVESWVEGKDCFGRRWRDWRVVLTCGVGDEAEGDGDICWIQRDFCKGGAGRWFGGQGDAGRVARRVVRFIRQVIQSVGHLSVSFAVRIFAKVFVLVPVGVSDVTEGGSEQNVGILTR